MNIRKGITAQYSSCINYRIRIRMSVIFVSRDLEALPGVRRVFSVADLVGAVGTRGVSTGTHAHARTQTAARARVCPRIHGSSRIDFGI